jgi:hypothetical protein
MSGSGESFAEVDAATGGVDARAWALVQLAGDLRARGHYDDALRTLDVAWHLCPGDSAELAVYACAVAIHCDRGQYQRGLNLERSFVRRGIDVRLALAFERLHDELFAANADERHRERREFYRSFVALFAAVA